VVQVVHLVMMVETMVSFEKFSLWFQSRVMVVYLFSLFFPYAYSFTYFAYSLSGTPSFFEMATCDGVSRTVPLRLIGIPLFAEATACVGGELCPNL
jgi:hypothetical protein